MKKVLLIDDDEFAMNLMLRQLNPLVNKEIQIFKAKNITEAEELFYNNSDIEVVVIDLSTKNNLQQALTFIGDIKAGGYSKAIVANANSESDNLQMLTAGATHENKLKMMIRKIISNILD